MNNAREPAQGLRDGVIKRGKSWSYVIRVTNAEGVSRPRWVGGFPSEEAAKAARDEARVAARRGEYVDRSRVTVADYLRDWLKTHALEVKPKTRSGYAFNIERYVVPHIGGLRLQTLRPSTLSGLYRQLLDTGGAGGKPLSPRSVEYVHAVLRKALNDAVLADQLLPSNPALRAKRPKRTNSVEPWAGWGADELATFLAVASKHRLHALFHLAAHTGARRGELLHLEWSDIDLGPSPSVRIRGSVGRVDGQRVSGSPKSGRSRIVSIDAGTSEVLRRHKADQVRDEQIASGSWVVGDWVFRQQIGSPLHPDTPTGLMAKLLAGFNAEADVASRLPKVRFHDLRHIHATLLLRAGVPVHVVAARLGHADPAITLRVYAHVLGDQAVSAADAFAALLEPARDRAERAGRS